MKNVTWSIWIGIAAVLIVSLGLIIYLPVDKIYKEIFSISTLGALLLALFQLYRESSMHTREIQLQNEQQLFNLGATSHMANVVFDKHVEFCEKYLSTVHQTIQRLIKNGPNLSAAFDADNLTELRIEYTAWITPEINDKLQTFEQAVKKIGANTLQVTLHNESADKENEGERSQAIKEMYALINGILEKQSSEENAETEDISAEALKDYVRKILQVDQLVSIREYLVEKASSVATGK